MNSFLWHQSQPRPCSPPVICPLPLCCPLLHPRVFSISRSALSLHCTPSLNLAESFAPVQTDTEPEYNDRFDGFHFQNKSLQPNLLRPKGHPQVGASQRSRKQLVPVVLSRYTSPDDMADRDEQREAPRGKKHELRGQLWGNREKKQRLNHSVMGQRAAQDPEPRKNYNKRKS